MTMESLLNSLESLGGNLEIRDGRLYCTLPRRLLPPVLLKAIHEQKQELVHVVWTAPEAERSEWIMTPGGPGKVWGFLPGGRIGVVLRSDILSKPEGERPVRFYATKSTACLRSQDLRKPSERQEPETGSQLHATAPSSAKERTSPPIGSAMPRSGSAGRPPPTCS